MLLRLSRWHTPVLPASASRAVPRQVLPVIVLSQFAGTSLWFATNAVMGDMQREWRLPPEFVGTLTAAVQLGFVAGTLVFALLMLADRFSPQRIFLACSLAGALMNALVLATAGAMVPLLALRFAVGFVLAGIYPIGMKIAASWYREELGKVLGVLVGALVLGTAFPHGLRAIADAGAGGAAPWRLVVIGVSCLAALGGIATAWLVPFARPQSATAPIALRQLPVIWSDWRLRASVFGYFGHIWELYAFYVVVPVILQRRFGTPLISGLAFWVIAAGFAGCFVGGLLVYRYGSACVAEFQLAVSALCCVLVPVLLRAPASVFIAWLVLWGTTVVGDGPQFLTLIAQNSPTAVVGSVLTFATCIGFAISVVSIELFVRAAHIWPLAAVLPCLAIGPALGLWFMRPLVHRATGARQPIG